MSVQSEINRIQTNVTNSLNAVAAKGVSVQSTDTSDQLPQLISEIPTDSPDNVKVIEQSFTDNQKSQARTNIGAGTSNFSGSYNDLSDTPTIPNEVTESTVSEWGFTKNTGTYSKPENGIPASDLASGVIPTSLPANGGTSASCSGNAATATTLKTSRKLWGQSFNGSADVAGNITVNNNAGISFKNSSGTVKECLNLTNTNNLRIGYDVSAAGGNLYPCGNQIIFLCGTDRTYSWQFSNQQFYPYVNNTMSLGNSTHFFKEAFLTKVTNTSDERLKDKICDNPLSVEQIANAPMIDFTWKSNGEKSTGSIAQYWKDVLPYLVEEGSDDNKTLSMDYSHMGLVTSIINAREIVKLKKENKILKEELENIKKTVYSNK